MTIEELFRNTLETYPECEKVDFYLGAAAMYAILTTVKSSAETLERMQDSWAEIQEFVQETYRGGED
jgi:hypothetical protein